jgi:hypothetical protein
MGLKKSKNRLNNIQGKKGSQFSSQLRGVNLERVLIVAIDGAKFFQKALLCNYYGDVLEKPFFFGVNQEGVDLICRKIEKAKNEIQAVGTRGQVPCTTIFLQLGIADSEIGCPVPTKIDKNVSEKSQGTRGQ